MQVNSQLMRTGITVERSLADIAQLPSHLLCLLSVVFLHHLIVICLCLSDFRFAHFRQARNDVLIPIRGRVTCGKVGAEHALVAIDGIVGDWVAEELEMNSNLVGAARDRQAADNRVAFFEFPGHLCVAQFVSFTPVIGSARIAAIRSLWWIVRETFERRGGRFPARSGSIETELGADLHDWLFTNNITFGKFANNPSNVFLFHISILYLYAYLLCCSRVLADEHDSAGQSVKTIARQWVPVIASF